jgi:chromosome segregation ATPase
MDNKSKLISVGIVVLILFCGGIIAGYYIWGTTNGDRSDFPAMLNDAARYITDLETRTSELEEQLASMNAVTPDTGSSEAPSDEAAAKPSTETETLEASAEGASDERSKNLEIQLKSLQEENAELQSRESESNRLLAQNRELEMEAQVCANEKAELEKKNAELQTVNDQNANLLAENQKLKTTIESNADEINTLKLRLDEIRAMTNSQSPPESKTEGTP